MGFASPIGNWIPQLGDQTPAGWLTVYLYYCTTLACCVAFVYHLTRVYHRSEARVWFSCALMMLCLSICKHFNLLSAFTEIGRVIARSSGWMDMRRSVQIIAMSILLVAAVVGSVKVVGYIPGRILRVYGFTYVGIMVLALFVVMRAISLHQLETVLSYTIAGIRWNSIIEIGCLVLIFISIIHRGFVSMGQPIPPRKAALIGEKIN